MAQDGIFISYRREDGADTAGRIYDRLNAAFGSERLFKDVDAIPVGKDFGAHIREFLARTGVAIVLIGPRWTEVRDATGGLRLSNAEDWVRVEVETALETPGVSVIPVLIGGAQMPRAQGLPASLVDLCTLNAATIRGDPDFHTDMDKLIRSIERMVPSIIDGRSSIPQTAASVWQQLLRTEDANQLTGFIERFAGSKEALDARVRIAQLSALQEIRVAVDEMTRAWKTAPLKEGNDWDEPLEIPLFLRKPEPPLLDPVRGNGRAASYRLHSARTNFSVVREKCDAVASKIAEFQSRWPLNEWDEQLQSYARWAQGYTAEADRLESQRPEQADSVLSSPGISQLEWPAQEVLVLAALLAIVGVVISALAWWIAPANDAVSLTVFVLIGAIGGFVLGLYAAAIFENLPTAVCVTTAIGVVVAIAVWWWVDPSHSTAGFWGAVIPGALAGAAFLPAVYLATKLAAVAIVLSIVALVIVGVIWVVGAMLGAGAS